VARRDCGGEPPTRRGATVAKSSHHGEERPQRGAGGACWLGGVLRWTFASAVGKGKFWVRDLFVVCDPNHRMRLVFEFRMLETV
jgi:hypothetical protein